MLSGMDDLPSIKIGDDILRFELDPLTEFGREVAQRELRETNEIKTKALEDLRELLKGKSIYLLISLKSSCVQFDYYLGTLTVVITNIVEK